jgi:hypothetical protein
MRGADDEGNEFPKFRRKFGQIFVFLFDYIVQRRKNVAHDNT